MRTTPILPAPLSLRPDEMLVHAYVLGNPIAREIIQSWRFHERVTLMTSAELDALSERCHTVFAVNHAG